MFSIVELIEKQTGEADAKLYLHSITPEIFPPSNKLFSSIRLQCYVVKTLLIESNKIQ